MLPGRVDNGSNEPSLLVRDLWKQNSKYVIVHNESDDSGWAELTERLVKWVCELHSHAKIEVIAEEALINWDRSITKTDSKELVFNWKVTQEHA